MLDVIMMATRAMSASSQASARRQRAATTSTLNLQKKEQRRAARHAEEHAKLTPELCLALLRKLAPKLLIGLGGIFVFVGILLTCMGFTPSLHYPEGKGIGLTMLILGLIAIPGGIAWRMRRLRHRAEREQRLQSTADTVSTSTAQTTEFNAHVNTAVSLTDVRVVSSDEETDKKTVQAVRPKKSALVRPVSASSGVKDQTHASAVVPAVKVTGVDDDEQKANDANGKSFEFM